MQCPLCQKFNILLRLYGVQCCNACSMYHRNHCKKNNQDSKTYFGNQNCSFCRAKQDQMIPRMSNPIDKLDSILSDLSTRDSHRETTFNSFSFSGMITVDDAMISQKIEFVDKVPNSTFEDWSTMNQLSTICFLKNLNFFNQLEATDSMKFMRGVRFRFAIFTTAFRSYQMKKGFMLIADGVDIFPDLSGYSINPDFLNTIRCLLVSKLVSLNITRSEYLIVSMIVVLGSAQSLDLTTSGQKGIKHHLDSYASVLLQYCIRQNAKNGPVRFSKLLSIFETVEATWRNIEKFTHLYRMRTLKQQSKEIIKFE